MFFFLLAGLLGAGKASAGAEWPDLSKPAKEVGGGRNDVAVVVGIEDYSFAPRVAGAKSNADAWYDYLTHTRGVPVENVKLLTGVDATREEILDATRNAASKASPKGTYWFIFIGHGVPSNDGKDGLLVGVDAQQKAASLQSRSVARSELLRATGESKAAMINVVLDACFSGRGQEGSPIAPGLQPLLAVPMAARLDPRLLMLTAARGDQFAGALPGARRPAFSYLVLGGLRGWASSDGSKVTGADLHSYAKNALGATLRGRDQTPEVVGSKDSVLAISAGEKAPDLAALVKATSGAKAELFKISSLPEIPVVNKPSSLNPNVDSEDWRELDVAALGRYDAVIKIDKSDLPAGEKIRRWRELGKSTPKYATEAESRATQWERYEEEFARTDKVRQERADARDRDWAKLGQLLTLGIVAEADKRRWAGLFVDAYGKTSDENPYVEELIPFLPKDSVTIVAGAKENALKRGRAGVEWVQIPGGEFIMGSQNGDPDEALLHTVRIAPFRLARTEVTFGQYKKCVEAGKCEKLRCDGAADIPVSCANWHQASAFSSWVGGRLPSESEWEYAAKGLESKSRIQDASNCASAAFGSSDCGLRGPLPVCSRLDASTPQGLCDMVGNVWEWTQDWYHNSYDSAPSDGSAWEYPAGSERIIRGGCWDSSRLEARVSYRGRAAMRPTTDLISALTSKAGVMGFRPAKSQ